MRLACPGGGAAGREGGGPDGLGAGAAAPAEAEGLAGAVAAGLSTGRFVAGGGGGGTGVRPEGRVGPAARSITFGCACARPGSSSGGATRRLIAGPGSLVGTIGSSGGSVSSKDSGRRTFGRPEAVKACAGASAAPTAAGLAPGSRPGPAAGAAFAAGGSWVSTSFGSSRFGHLSEVSQVGSGLAAAMPRPPALGRRMSPFSRVSSDASTRAVWFGTFTPRSPSKVTSLAELTPSMFASSMTGILPSGKNLTPSSGRTRYPLSEGLPVPTPAIASARAR